MLGHTHCGAISTAVSTAGATESIAKLTGCPHVEPVLREIQDVITPQMIRKYKQASPEEQHEIVNEVARANVLRTVEKILESSETLRNLVRDGQVAVVGALYDVTSGDLTFLTPNGASMPEAAETVEEHA